MNFHPPPKANEKFDSDKEDSSFERLRQNKNQFLQPSSDSSAFCLTDKAAESEGVENMMPEEYVRSESSIPSTNNIFERLYQEAKLKKKRQENLYDSAKPKKSKMSKSQSQSSGMKIEDKLMQKYYQSMMKKEQMRRDHQTQEMEILQKKPSVNTQSLEMTKNVKSFYQRQTEFIRKKQIEYEIKRKQKEDQEEKELKKGIKINERSKKRSHSNISQLVRENSQETKL